MNIPILLKISNIIKLLKEIFLNKTSQEHYLIFIIIWFFTIFSISFLYCVFHWQEVVVFKPFSGNSLILCFLLFWTLLPFIKKLKFKDIEGELNNPLLWQNKEDAELMLNETAHQKAPNINMDVNVQNEYRNEAQDIINKKGATNV